MCDVLIKTKEEDVFAHANVLATFSPYFRTLFTTNLHPNKNAQGQFIVDLSQFSQLAVELLIQFVYNNQNIDKELFKLLDLEDMIVLLDFTQTHLIQDIFMEAVRKVVSDDNWNRFYTFADQGGLEKLKTFLLCYVSYDFKKFVKCEAFKLLPFHTIESLLNCDLINCYPKHMLEDTVVPWLRVNEENRNICIKRL